MFVSGGCPPCACSGSASGYPYPLTGFCACAFASPMGGWFASMAGVGCGLECFNGVNFRVTFVDEGGDKCGVFKFVSEGGSDLCPCSTLPITDSSFRLQVKASTGEILIAFYNFLRGSSTPGLPGYGWLRDVTQPLTEMVQAFNCDPFLLILRFRMVPYSSDDPDCPAIDPDCRGFITITITE